MAGASGLSLLGRRLNLFPWDPHLTLSDTFTLCREGFLKQTLKQTIVNRAVVIYKLSVCGGT